MEHPSATNKTKSTSELGNKLAFLYVKTALGRRFKLLGLFMRRMLFAEVAEFIQLKTLFKLLFVLSAVIGDPFALRAFQTDKIVLRHK